MDSGHCRERTLVYGKEHDTACGEAGPPMASDTEPSASDDAYDRLGWVQDPSLLQKGTRTGARKAQEQSVAALYFATPFSELLRIASALTQG